MKTLIILFIVFLILVAIIFVAATRNKKTVSSTIVDDKDKIEEKDSSMKNVLSTIFGFISWIVIIAIFIAVLFAFSGLKDLIFGPAESEKEKPKYENIEVLEKVDSGFVSKDNPWVTPFVDYKFRLKTENNQHSFFVQYTSFKGGWTDSILVQKRTHIKSRVPEDAIGGKIRVSSDPQEDKPYMVYLLKRKIIKVIKK